MKFVPFLLCYAELDTLELANGDVFAGFGDAIFDVLLNGFGIVEDVGLEQENFVGEGFFDLSFEDLGFHVFRAFEVGFEFL